MQQHIAVMGLGLMGGSVALGARAAGAEVAGYDPDPEARAGARERGAVDAVFDRPEDAVASADIVVLAMPSDVIPDTCRALTTTIAPDAVVTDVGSAKSDIVAAGEAAFSERFVGGHPMAGSERHGIAAADGQLFLDSWWILTPTQRTSSSAYRRAGKLATMLGAMVVALAPEQHDDLIAHLSHVPQLTASALVALAASSPGDPALLRLAGGGFRDVTRIAASNPDLWIAILKSNRAATLEGLGSLGALLGDVAGLIAAERWAELRAWLADAQQARLELFAKPVYVAEPVGLALLVPDRPGVLAEVTTAAGRLGANIEDLRILHSTEGGRGRLELVVGGHDAADALADELTALGYRVEPFDT